jgi:hypothetical protein
MSDQLVAEAATYTTHNIHKKKIYTPAGLEISILANKWPQTCELDCTATGIGKTCVYNYGS